MYYFLSLPEGVYQLCSCLEQKLHDDKELS